MEDLKLAAQKIQEKGRDGDTILAHINPQEAELLKMMGGSGTINPETGLPEYKKFWKRIKEVILPVAAIVIAVVAPELAPAIGEALGFTGGAAATAGNAVIGASVAAAQGAKPEDIAKAAVLNIAGSAAGSAAASSLPAETAKTITGAVGGATSGATQAALSGGDIGRGATTGGIVGGTVGGYRDITTPSPTYGITSAYEQYASNIDPALRETMSYQDVLRGAIESPYYSQARTNIDPSKLETMSSEEVARSPSLTATSPGVMQYPKLTKAGEQLAALGSREFARSLYKTPSTVSSRTTDVGGVGGGYTTPERTSSTLTSTGLFQPTSIVPTESMGIAPIARGKPILGGEDEEATGAWGSKTLRG